MVKFSKQFEGQLIPEWKEAFVDYWQLKKDLKRFHPTDMINNENNKKPTNFFSSTLTKFSAKLISHKNKDHQPIQVHRKLASSASAGDMYETELLEQFGEGSDAVKEFFSCLDNQLNKVNQFYRSKENEFVERGESMKKQMEILLQLKAALNKHHHHHHQINATTNSGAPAADSCNDSRELDASIFCTFAAAEEDSVRDRAEQEQLADDSDRQEIPFSDLSVKSDDVGKSMRSNSRKLSRSLSSRSVSCQGKNVRITIPLTTPTRTFSAISSLLFEDLINQSSKKLSATEGSRVSINKAKLHRAEKMIRGAFVELYKGLRYLETYRSLNMLAFLKILKKFDKVTGKQVQPIYVRVVEGSYFNSSNKVMHLADQVEELFIKNFAADDRTKAMKYLKPDQRKDTHTKTFFVGLFSGCFISLLVGYIIMAHLTGTYRRRHDDSLYMETAYPVFSMFSLMFLHVFLYGCNIFAWRKTRINYSFIFELAPTKELKYRDIFLISATSMTVVVGVMFAHLALLSKGYSYSQVQAIPGFLLLVFLLILVCPLNIVYRPSRYRFLRAIRNIALSPLYKVVMLDFFMADQLCSQVPMLRNLEYIACYYITGSYKNQDYGYCMRNKHYQDLAYAVSFLPYFWRAMQCGRRWFDEGEASHLVNLGKYMSAMVAAGTKVAYEKEKTVGWLCLVVTVSSLATVYQLYWDFVKDWGLLQNNSNNPWLRNELMLRRRLVYYISMVLNLILRLAWLQTVLHSSFGHVDYRVTGLFLAALEVIRRGLWNFFRLENEHLNNAGKFRAVKIVPLPFHQVDEED